MRTRVLGYGLAVGLLVALLVAVGLVTGAFVPYLDGYDPADPEGYELATVTVLDDGTGEELGRVEAAVADDFLKRYMGLSKTEALPADRGMLFVHDDAGEHTYVMRGMSFGIDIVFVDARRTVTEIHEAPAPGPNEDGSEMRYTGEGTRVLEVQRGWTDEHGVEVGDRVVVDHR